MRLCYVLEEISAGNPVRLTDNNRVDYVIVDAKEYELHTKEKVALQLLLELNKTIYENGVPYDEVKILFVKK